MKKRLTDITILLASLLLLTSCGKTMQDAIDQDPELAGTETAAWTNETEGTEALGVETEGTEAAELVEADPDAYEFTICFAGDLSLADDAITTQNYLDSANGIFDCISPTLVETMQNADFCVLNNEFTYSTRGSALAGKTYTFRGNPEYVSVLNDLGVDAVNLANNHVYDYGEDALLDTFDTLTGAGIPYFGAGHDLEEATSPYYFEVDGKTVALVAASRAEKNLFTPQATEDSPGILRCYDTELFVEEIKEAKENADFVIAYVHWGTEYSTVLESAQTETAREYIDAGADAVIGAHPHCLQGMEYYNGVPIIYSLGNFWFNDKTLDTMLIELHFSGDDEDGKLSVQVIPALQTGGKTYYVEDSEEQQDLYDYLTGISVNTVIDSNGYLWEEE